MTKSDPLDVMGEINKEREERDALHAAKQRSDAEWIAAWRIDWEKEPVAQFLELGNKLRERRCGFWLDYWEINSVRQRIPVEQKGGISGTDLRDYEYAYSNTESAVKFLKLSYRADKKTLQSKIRKAKQKKVLRDVCGKIRDIGESLDQWHRQDHSPPFTPFMARSELAASLRGKFEGFGNSSGVKVKIDNGVLLVREEWGPAKDGKTRYAYFRHRENEFQRQILQLVVAYLKKPKFHSFYLESFWTAETPENGA